MNPSIIHPFFWGGKFDSHLPDLPLRGSFFQTRFEVPTASWPLLCDPVTSKMCQRRHREKMPGPNLPNPSLPFHMAMDQYLLIHTILSGMNIHK